MKNVLKLLPFFLMVSLLVFSCSKDDDTEEEEEETCVTDPTVTIEENIIGTWIIDNATAETVTFNSDGTGSAAEDAFHFTTDNEGTTYTNFDWEMDYSDDYGDRVKITYDYSPDVPVIPFIVSESYTVTLNNCDKIEMESGWGSELQLTR